MKINARVLTMLVLLIMFCIPAVWGQAAPKIIDLREYQQAPNTVKVLESDFDGTKTYIATINYQQKLLDDKTAFYQGVFIVGKNGTKTLYPLLVKKVIVSHNQFQEAILDRQGNMPYRQGLRKVATTSRKPVEFVGGDATSMVLLGTYKIDTPLGEFPDSIGIRIYNSTTHEGMIKYLAPGKGVIYMEGIRADGSKVAVAQVTEIRPISSEDIEALTKTYILP